MKENQVNTIKGVITLIIIDSIIKDFVIGFIKERKEIFENLFQTKFKEDLIKQQKKQ